MGLYESGLVCGREDGRRRGSRPIKAKTTATLICKHPRGDKRERETATGTETETKKVKK